MKKEDLVIAGLVVVALGLVIATARQNKINTAQKNLDNQFIAFAQTVAEKLDITALPNTNIVDTGAGN